MQIMKYELHMSSPGFDYCFFPDENKRGCPNCEKKLHCNKASTEEISRMHMQPNEASPSVFIAGVSSVSAWPDS